MPDPIIEAENISKMFRLNKPATGSLRQDLKQAWLSAIGKEDSFFTSAGKKKSDLTELWALRNVNLQVAEGEVLGVVGPNGAGKSTLLKILSRITRPTEGVIRGRGRISSLLEIGTGFQHELSGRENIYLSGHMLGMKKKDIQKKFSEIVEFSGVERFLDTQVKRYSSGMYVRLAFAVAAHLEPDILIVDEVLAVGDAEFQRKCIGKMKEVSSQSGRTILFVSHNMQAISNLCSRAILLQKGHVTATGQPQQVINQYFSALRSIVLKHEWMNTNDAPGNMHITMKSVELVPQLPEDTTQIDIRTPLTVKFRFYNHNENIVLATGLHLFTASGECIFDVTTDSTVQKAGLIEGECKIPGNFLNDGSYYFSIIFVKDTSQELYYFEDCLQFEVEDHRENIAWYGKWQGYVRPRFPFSLNPVE